MLRIQYFLQNATYESPDYAVFSSLLLLPHVYAHFLNPNILSGVIFLKIFNPLFLLTRQKRFTSIQNNRRNYVKSETLTEVIVHYLSLSVLMIEAVRLFKR